MTIPPIIFYVLGTLFLVFGILRATFLGRRRADRELQDETPQRAKLRKQHLFFGIFWIGVGVFLILSTAGIVGPRR
jgi:hypothetical protein